MTGGDGPKLLGVEGCRHPSVRATVQNPGLLMVGAVCSQQGLGGHPLHLTLESSAWLMLGHPRVGMSQTVLPPRLCQPQWVGSPDVESAGLRTLEPLFFLICSSLNILQSSSVPRVPPQLPSSHSPPTVLPSKLSRLNYLYLVVSFH